MNRDPAVLEQRIQHLVVTAPILPAARVDHDIDLLGHQLAMPGLKKEIWAIIKADRFLTDDEVRFKTWDLVSRTCSAWLGFRQGVSSSVTLCRGFCVIDRSVLPQ
jgi:hypothetical protein